MEAKFQMLRGCIHSHSIISMEWCFPLFIQSSKRPLRIHRQRNLSGGKFSKQTCTAACLVCEQFPSLRESQTSWRPRMNWWSRRLPYVYIYGLIHSMNGGCSSQNIYSNQLYWLRGRLVPCNGYRCVFLRSQTVIEHNGVHLRCLLISTAAWSNYAFVNVQQCYTAIRLWTNLNPNVATDAGRDVLDGRLCVPL